VWVANLHATVHNAGAAVRDGRLAAAAALGWAGDGAVVLGGDFNVRELSLNRFRYAGGHDVDLVFLRGLTPRAGVEVLDRGRLSDHAPVLVTVS
jgi:endonuclease/exonuclease/phosphatase (EEP) superfamily protein YafD